MSMAVALTASSMRTIKKEKMLQMLRKKNKASNSLLAHMHKSGPAVVEIPILSHQVLAEMVGTTLPRVNLFMNRFRKQGFINYDGGLEVNQSLREVLRSR